MSVATASAAVPSSTSSIDKKAAESVPSSSGASTPSARADAVRSSKSRERERERERGSSERERDRDVRHRSSRDRDSGRHHRDRDSDRYRERDTDRDRDTRDIKRSRHSQSRSRSPPRPSKPTSTSSTSSSRSSRHSSRSQSPVRPPLPSPSSSNNSDHRSSEESREDRERDRADHTVFVSQIHPKVSERDLFDFFSLCGRVEDVRLIKDKTTKRSKGLGYVEFRDRADTQKALALNGQLLAGYPITVQMTQYPPSKESAVYSADSLRLYVGSLQYQITEADIRPIFAAFGPIDSIEVHKDAATGISKGFGFVQYRHKADAEVALKALQGVEVGGRPMKLGLATQAGSGTASFPNMSSSINAPSPLLPSPSSAASASALLSTQLPSTCLLIINMFDPREETESDWDLDIAEEMKDEGSKYGQLLHVKVEKESQGHVYLRFATVESASAAFAAMNGRWFGGKQLMASFIPETTYRLRYPS